MEIIKSTLLKRRRWYPIWMLSVLLIIHVNLCFSQETVFRVAKIWDHANHNAFTDLIRHEGKFYCTFREADSHLIFPSKQNGRIRILSSEDGYNWISFALISKEGFDLRDPKLSNTPEGRLMLLVGALEWDKDKEKQINSRNTQVSFLDEQTGRFSALQEIIFDENFTTGHNWLWRITWWRGTGYGVVYTDNAVYLVQTSNGIHYSFITELNIPGSPSEASVAFKRSDEMVMVIRRDGDNEEDRKGYIGRSFKPYTEWTWTPTERLGGPAMIRYTDEQFIVASRSYKYEKEHTTLYLLGNDNRLNCITELPSHRDCSYAGMVFYDNKLWVSYYSSHEGKSSIYLATVPLSYIEHNIW